MKKLFFLLTYLICLNTQAQLSSSDILAGIRRLGTTGSVLYIAAHPDDENTRLLTYLVKERNLRTGYLSLTRGDGGQNLIGKEQGDPLGLIRTQELLAARRTDGAEQFFTRANDFGFSKNPEETFSIWNKDSILADVVLAIRKFRPDVIICRFPTTGEGGHGHHTASAILALEAFDAAADPKKFPEQLAVAQAWKAKRIFWNTFNFGGTNNTPPSPDYLKLDVGGYNALLGKSYGEIAAESRSMHKSQGFGSAKARGESVENFKFLKGDSAKKDLFEGIDLGWSRISAGALKKSIEDCIKKYDTQAPEKSLDDLIAIYKQLQQMDESNTESAYWKKIKLKECENLLLACCGLWMEAYPSDYITVPGMNVPLTLQIISRNKDEVKLNGISFFGKSDTSISKTLRKNELYTFKHTEKIPDEAPCSNPYWLNEKHSTGMFTVKSMSLIGKPQNDAAEKVVFDISLSGLNLKVERDVVYKYSDPVKGELYRPFELLPPATINIPEKVFVFGSSAPKQVLLTIKANASNIKGSLQIKVPSEWTVSLQKTDFALDKKGDETIVEATITPGKNAEQGNMEVSLNIDGKTYNKSIRRIDYDHIPPQFILNDAESRLVRVDLKKGGTNVGYIPGAGDDIPACLKQIGYDVTILTDELLAKENLQKYNCIITGVRAYNTNERLQLHYSKLMEYVKNGGNLVVQYNTNSRVGPVNGKIGPYPFTVSRDRVTDDKAEVRFVNPKHSVLNFPNIITQKDFEGWVQERGIYFASDIDKNYETVFSMNDPGEKPSEGSLITAKYGKGNFVYTGLVFFRELPAGVPGAYRLFVNLLSIPANK
jgi:LmbE family N-acetylglucosaminyl deacetylase